MRKTIGSLAVLGILLVAGCPQQATQLFTLGGQTFEAGFGTATLTSQTTTGVSEDASPCTGFFPLQPNHTLTLLEATTGLGIGVESSSDVVLWIRFGQSSFCGDVSAPNVTRGSWSAGDYEIFVGTPTQNATATYTLRITE